MKRIVFAAAVVVAAGLSGCQTPARDVSFDPMSGSGIVKIPANTDTFPNYYRREAMALIEKHVGPNYEIVEEREIPIGQTTLNNQQVNNGNVSGVSTTQTLTEYHIAYRKRMLPTTVMNGMPNMPNTPGVGGVQQTQYRPGAGLGAQPAGGLMPPGAQGNSLVPSVAPAGGALPGGGSGLYGNGGATFGGIR